MECKIGENLKSQIIFQVDNENWAIKITKEGIIFNRELYPVSMPDDFAKCFIELLERSYKVKFLEKEEPK